ncbi:MAG: S8 family serine peptidase [Betaproteobacteria bacterium]|nr:S8 family serine peptidase [Betaproteobacteria bacterium]
MPCRYPAFVPAPRAARASLSLFAALLLTTAALPTAAATETAHLRVMLHPTAAPRGQLPAERRVKLEAVAGAKLTLAGVTRTGGLDLAVDGSPDPATIAALIGRLRGDRAVLWAEPARPAFSARRATKAAASAPGHQLLVRLADDAVPDWPTLLPRLAERAGAALAVGRSIGNVWVLELAQAQPASKLAAMATALQDDAAVQYADPVLRKYARTLPDDPRFGQQWALTDPLAGIAAPAAWNVNQGVAGMAIAVIDTGILPHPDLAGRILAGYDFISDEGNARDGSPRDPDASDEGDWTEAGACGGFDAQDSSWHGTFIAGQLAANANDGRGVAGVNWRSSILPVRALGQCGGTDVDVFEGMLWASGVPIAGVPANPNPAKVINMSLGGAGACAQAIQEAVDDALAQGAVVVVAAGNEAADAQDYAPANCSGVITVGAHNRNGERAYYSNFGRRIDLSAPAGDGDGIDDAILSTSNDGRTVPGAPSYRYGIGTSFATPYVAGAASLMLARNPTLTPGRVLGILQGTARDFPLGSTCRTGGLCGAGMLDAGAAVASTPPSTLNPPPGAVPVVEYYHAALDHYFITASAAEMAALDGATDGAFVRTGYFFYGYADASTAPAGAQPVCRFYADADVLINSHYFTADATECSFVRSRWPDIWRLEQPDAFYVQVPDSAGSCPDETLPVYRFFNNRRDASHRYTIDLSVRRSMINRSWVPEGNGATAAVFCTPI